MKKLNGARYLLSFSVTVFFFMFGLAIIGGWKNYTAIPFWDMWDGTIDFLLKVRAGDYGVWWEQHNEHRILLARIIFWLDSEFFGDVSIFSVFANYCLFAVSGLIFYFYAKDLAYEEQLSKDYFLTFVFTLFSWVFLLTQSDNFYLAFQSQFILAQLLPLSAFYFLARYAQLRQVIYFILAFCCAALAIGSMANGVLAFPLMFIYACLLRLDGSKCVVLLIAAVIFPIAYFFHYQAPDGHGHLMAALLERPDRFLCYVLMYIGSPFHYLLGKGNLGPVAAVLAGGAFVSFALLSLYRQWQKKQKSAFVFALLFFIAYIIGTAVGTAGGRLIFGVEQALETRYTTPAIMAWAALALVMGKTFAFTSINSKKMLCTGTILLMVAMLGFQLKVLKPVDTIYKVRQQAAIALALKVNDTEYLKTLFPDPDYSLKISGEAATQGISVFARPPFSEMMGSIGKKLDVNNVHGCIGSVDHVAGLGRAPDYIRIDGWVYSSIDKKSPERMTIVNDQGLIAGYAIVGMPRDDVGTKFGSTARNSGFGGYVKKSLLTQSMYGIGSAPQCHFVMK
ncbi:hypothetical protein [Vogesella oryzae]|uniref:hypothetical protein n=1 Tax=Vogesella oryzae TaxID=1735285 RepID=UPI001583D5AE|nr:hypothetical protein [Vogesella oryzae]